MPCKCKDCGLEYDGRDGHMIMLKDDLWKEVSQGRTRICLCDKCIEKRLGRQILFTDLTDAACNETWLRKHHEAFLKANEYGSLVFNG